MTVVYVAGIERVYTEACYKTKGLFKISKR